MHSEQHKIVGVLRNVYARGAGSAVWPLTKVSIWSWEAAISRRGACRQLIKTRVCSMILYFNLRSKRCSQYFLNVANIAFQTRGVHFEKTSIFFRCDISEVYIDVFRSKHRCFFDAIYRKCTSMSSEVSIRNIDVFFDAIYRKCTSMSSEVTVRNIDVFFRCDISEVYIDVFRSNG